MNNRNKNNVKTRFTLSFILLWTCGNATLSLSITVANNGI